MLRLARVDSSEIVSTTKPSESARRAVVAPRPMTELAGWGANRHADCVLIEPELPEQVAASLDRAGSIARGLGRSYGDASINEGRQVIGMTRANRYLGFDAETGTLTCEAGVSLADIISTFAPRGWFPMITPGTKFVTIGGCIANDIHGKGHHVHGSFSSCVDAIRVLLASGEIVNASPTENADLFWASFGGMGLLGVILTATLRLRRIETTYFRQVATAVGDLEAMLAMLHEHDQAFPYSVATLDVFATGARIGRGVVVSGNHATLAELPPKLARDPLRVSSGPKLDVPFNLPEFTLNPLTMRVLNAIVLGVQTHAGAFGHYDGFVYPLDVLGNWNRGYGRRGFTQYQFVVPFNDGLRHMRQILGAILSSGELPFLNVLKRFGKASEGVLSFPREGYTFAIDLPIRDGTPALLKRLDAMVSEAGGRVYLGKDSFLDAATFRAMYPELDRWLAIKAKYDPHNVFTSDLGRRVGLVPSTATVVRAPAPEHVAIEVAGALP
jgi:decaprenylphospho-beta-D-ribofuranose 2-oxidase